MCAWVGALALAVLAAACTDPRARPSPPIVQIVMETPLVVASPGSLLGTVHVTDPNGIDSIRVRVELGNGSTLGDSVFFVSGDDLFQTALPLQWRLPGGVPNRTTVRVVARARSYLGFVAADTVLTAVGDTLWGGT